MQKKANPQTENQKIIDAYDYLANAASSQDCTGLIPTPPLSASELQSYEDVYKYQPPCVAQKKKEPTDHSL